MKNARKRKILIVEPDADFLAPLVEFLHHQRFEVATAGRGDEGLRQATEFQPDLILLSRELPMDDGVTGPDGLRVLKELKQDRKLASLPVILTSAEASEKDFERYRKLKFSAEDYLRKPFEDTELLRRVENLIGFDLSGEVDRIKARIHDVMDDPLAGIFNAEAEELGISSATRQEVSRLLEEMGEELSRHENEIAAEGKPETAPPDEALPRPRGEELPAEEEIHRLRLESQALARHLDLAQKQLVAERKRAREIKREWKQKLTAIEARLKQSEERENRMRKEFERMRRRFADQELEHTMELEQSNKEKRYLEEEVNFLQARLEEQKELPAGVVEDLNKVGEALQMIIRRLESLAGDKKIPERSRPGDGGSEHRRRK